MRLLLDTSAYSALMKGDDWVVRQVRNAEEVLLSAIVVGELLFGFRGGSRFTENLASLEAFLRKPFVTFVPVTRTTADRFSRVAMQLKQRGTPIPTNDIWIAAHALETGADLLSPDDHFRQVEGLAWLGPPPMT